VERQWSKILSGRVSLADFVFAKEVRLGTYSGKGPPPSAAIVATKAMSHDPRAEPRYGERIPYIVVHGPPGDALQFTFSFPVLAIIWSAGLRDTQCTRGFGFRVYLTTDGEDHDC
jgi:hypothetical protein